MNKAPAHKPNGTDGMLDHHYAAMFASFLHCGHTCARGLKHLDSDHHTKMAQLHSYPDKATVTSILDTMMADMLHHEGNIPPHLRAAFCHQHDAAKRFLAKP